MNYDIGDLLKDWQFDPDEFTARRIKGEDGSEKIQIRIDMGLLQLEVEGRPDRERPHGCESLLAYYESRRYAQERFGRGESLQLDEEKCQDLFQEAWQYYHRYLSLFYLEDYAGVVRDTEHTMRIFELVQSCSDDDEVKWHFEQYYPHAIMMRVRALAMQALGEENYAAALGEVEEGIQQLQRFVDDFEGEMPEEDLPEMVFLREWHEELEQEKPLSPREELERDLQVAVEAENF